MTTIDDAKADISIGHADFYWHVRGFLTDECEDAEAMSASNNDSIPGAILACVEFGIRDPKDVTVAVARVTKCDPKFITEAIGELTGDDQKLHLFRMKCGELICHPGARPSHY